MVGEDVLMEPVKALLAKIGETLEYGKVLKDRPDSFLQLLVLLTADLPSEERIRIPNLARMRIDDWIHDVKLTMRKLSARCVGKIIFNVSL